MPVGPDNLRMQTCWLWLRIAETRKTLFSFENKPSKNYSTFVFPLQYEVPRKHPYFEETSATFLFKL